jgi:hypothetical protein
MSDNVVNLCIPHIFAGISREEVISVFKKLGLPPTRVVLITNERQSNVGIATRRVYVHAKTPMPGTPGAELIARIAAAERPVNVVYDTNTPWFWSISMARPR